MFMFFNIFYWLKTTSFFDILPCGVNSQKKIIIAPKTPEITNAFIYKMTILFGSCSIHTVLGTFILFP